MGAGQTVDEYNAFLNNVYIDISSLEEAFILRERQDGKTQRVSINLSKKFVRRIFSRGEWHFNGRFYGEFWHSVAGEYRKDIKIDDVPTINVHYKRVQPAILASAKGVEFNKDCYNLGETIIPRLTSEEQRDALKLLVLTSINPSEREIAYRAHRDSSTIKLTN